MPRRFYLKTASRNLVKTPRRKPAYPIWYVPLFAAVGVVIAVAVFWAVAREDQTAQRVPERTSFSVATNASRDTTAATPAGRQVVSETLAVEKAVTPAVALTGVRVQVLNGCGVKGLARRLTPALRGLGLDVRETKNAARNDYEQTLLINRTSKLEVAHALADSLGISPEQVTSEVSPNLADIDLTLIVGLDYRNLNLNFQRTNTE